MTQGILSTNLIVLAVATEGPATLSGMSKAEKAVNPVTWMPTWDVVEAAVDRSLAAGYFLPVDCERFERPRYFHGPRRPVVSDDHQQRANVGRSTPGPSLFHAPLVAVGRSGKNRPGENLKMGKRISLR
jgi:hypothetical protein